MSTRYARKDVEIQAGRLFRAAERMGWDTSEWHVSIGSKTYGNAYRLYKTEAPSTGHSRTELVDDYLGMTAAEAHRTLDTMARTLEAVAYSSPFYCAPAGVE